MRIESPELIAARIDQMTKPKICCCCGLQIEALIEKAHIPDRKTAPTNTANLCILCHRAYDIGLMTDQEIEEARSHWLSGFGARYSYEELVSMWADRKADWSKLHKDAQKRAGLTIRRRTRARKAVKTRRARMEKI